jgi:hypothetical protein
MNYNKSIFFVTCGHWRLFLVSLLTKWSSNDWSDIFLKRLESESSCVVEGPCACWGIPSTLSQIVNNFTFLLIQSSMSAHHDGLSPSWWALGSKLRVFADLDLCTTLCIVCSMCHLDPRNAEAFQCPCGYQDPSLSF